MFTNFTLAAASPVSSGMGAFANIVPLVLIFVVFYFLLIRPQQKRMKAHRAKVADVKKGDQIVTGGGLVGKVTKVDDLYLEVDLGSTKVKVVKTTLSDVIDPMVGAPAND